MNALQLLDEHLVRIGSKLYPKSRVDRIYDRLSNPTPGEFYKGDRVQGVVSPGGEVSVAVSYPDVQQGYSLYKPAETQMPAPIKEVGRTIQQFNNTVQENPGLYYSRPVSGDGMRLSQAMGFEGDAGRMFVDTRRFRNLPTVSKLLGYKDAERFGAEQALMHGYNQTNFDYLSGVAESRLPQRKYSRYEIETLRNGGYIGDDGYVYEANGEIGF